MRDTGFISIDDLHEFL